MSNDALSAESRAALLKDLKQLRANQAATAAMIKRIEELLGVSEGALPAGRPAKAKAPRELAALGPGDACVWMLRQKGAPMTNRDLYDALAAVGYKKLKTTDHVGAAMHHRAKKPQDVRRQGKHWVYVGEPGNAAQVNGAEQAPL